MVLEMYIDGKLADSAPLSLSKITNGEEKELYIRGAVNHLLEKWDDLIEDQNFDPKFCIKGQFSFR